MRFFVTAVSAFGAILGALLFAAPIHSSATAKMKTLGAEDRIQCPPGYHVTVLADGLDSPDGLAFDPQGMLYVAEELGGRVSRINQDGSVTPVLTGLRYPEGIAFDDEGSLYVVEDVANGSVVKRAADGTVSALSTGHDAPEGVVWAPNGTLYITESNVQFANPLGYRTSVSAIDSGGVTSSLRTDALFWSYAGITVGPEGLLYVTNEASGTGTNDSVFVVNPADGSRTLFASGLSAPEGLRFSPVGGFLLFVAEEGNGDGTGRLSQVDANGDHAPFCTGFLHIEDVAVDTEGRLAVSEDGSGSVILIEPALSLGQTAAPADGLWVKPRDVITYTLVITNNSAANLTGLVLTDTLSPGTDLITDSLTVPSGWDKAETLPSTVVLTGVLAAGESAQVTLSAKARYGVSGTVLENRVEAVAQGISAVSNTVAHRLFVAPSRRRFFVPLFVTGLGFAARARGRR